MSRKNVNFRITLAALAIVIVFAIVFSVVRCGTEKDAVAAMPEDAIATGVHRGVRSDWKKILLSPIVSRMLCSYGIEARDLVKKPGLAWTMRLAIADELATAVIKGENGDLVLCAASPAHGREPLLRLFLALDWIPGLRRLEHGDGFKYVDISSRKSSKPLYLSIAMRGNVLMGRLGKIPMGFGQGCGKDGVSCTAPDWEYDHAICLKKGMLELAGVDSVFEEAFVHITPTANLVEASITAQLGETATSIFDTIAKEKLSGRNSDVSSLAGDHAIAVLSFPAAYASPLVRGLIGCGKGEKSTEDAMLYITSGEFGAKLFAFDIPAITVSVPGLSMKRENVVAATKAWLPKQMRNLLVVHGEHAVCTSLSSLEAQKHSPKVEGFSWNDAFKQFGNGSGCGFLFMDVDPFAGEMAKIVSAFSMLRSFGVMKVDKETSAALAAVSKALPRVPSGTSISAMLSGASGTGEARLDLRLETK